MSGEASADTYHIQGHDDHEIDADASAGGGKLPVLLHKIPADGGKLLHRNETENHHGKHGSQYQGNLHRGIMGGVESSNGEGVAKTRRQYIQSAVVSSP